MKEIPRLAGEYRRSRAFDRVGLLFGFPIRPDGGLVVLLLGCGSSFSQAFLSTSASAQGFTPPAAGVDRITEDDTSVMGAAGLFGAVSAECPSLLVSMIEENRGRPGWAVSHGGSLEGNEASELELDRRPLVSASPKMPISARESVTLRGWAGVATSDRARYPEFTSAIDPLAELLDENASFFSLLPKEGWGSWPQSFAPRADRDTQRADSYVAWNQAGNDFRPLMVVGLGAGTFPGVTLRSRVS